MRVGDLASGRSGDKGDGSNVGIFVKTKAEVDKATAVTRDVGGVKSVKDDIRLK